MDRKVAVASLSVASNSALVAAKISVGLLIGSVSVLSEAIHSGVDLVASCIALMAVRLSAKPADEDHPFGHGKIENISGVVEALLIFAAAAWIVWEAAHKLMRLEPVETPFWGVLVMGLSAAVNLFVSAALFRVGRETDSMALVADAWHLRTDVYTSAGVMAGLAVYWAGSFLWPGVDLRWVDPVAAILVAGLIAKASFQLTTEGVQALLDTRLSPEREQRIHDLIRAASPPVFGYHNLRTRRSGPQSFVDVHLVMDKDMTVLDSHDVAMRISREIERELPGCGVTTHVEPCVGCKPKCLAGCLLTDEQRAERHGPGAPRRG